MSRTSYEPRTWGRRLVLTVLAAAGALLLWQPVAAADPTVVTPPGMPGTPALPGPLTDPGKPTGSAKTLKLAPDVAPARTSVTLTAAGLTASKDVSIVWMTANVSYVLDPKLDSLDYIGRKVDKIGTLIAKARTDAKGALNVKLKTPVDFGGLHDVFVVADGQQLG